MKSSLLLLSANIFLIVVHALPLEHEYVMPNTPGEPLQPATEELLNANPRNRAKVEDAMVQANANLNRMQAVLDNHEDPNNKALIVAAFGQKTYEDHLDDIKNNVKAINNARLPIDLTKGKEGVFSGRNPSIGATYRDEDLNPTHVQFGEKFYTPFRSNDIRAGTIIHEAAHYAVRAGHLSEISSIGVPSTSQEISRKNPDYAKTRDIARNMHQNAESYAVFGNLCAHNTRREYIRALEAGDYHTASKIFRRDGESCELPHDYFTKKAATKSTPKANQQVDAKSAPKGPVNGGSNTSQSNKPNTAVASISQQKGRPISKALAPSLQKATTKSGSTTSSKPPTGSRSNSLSKDKTLKAVSQKASRPQSAGSSSKLPSTGRGLNKSPGKSNGRPLVQGKPNLPTTSRNQVPPGSTSNGRKSNTGPAKSSGRQVPQSLSKRPTKPGAVPASKNGPSKANSKQTRLQNLSKQPAKLNPGPLSNKAPPKSNKDSKPASTGPKQGPVSNRVQSKSNSKPASPKGLSKQPSQPKPGPVSNRGPPKSNSKATGSQSLSKQPSQPKPGPVSNRGPPKSNSKVTSSQSLSKQPSQPKPVPQGFSKQPPKPATLKAPPTLNSKPTNPQQPLVGPKRGKR